MSRKIPNPKPSARTVFLPHTPAQQFLFDLIVAEGWEGTHLLEQSERTHHETAAMWLAVRENDFGGEDVAADLVRQMGEAGVDLNAKDPDGDTFLWYCTRVEPYLAATTGMVDLFSVNKAGDTILTAVVFHLDMWNDDSPDVTDIFVLLQAGLVPDGENDWGQRFLEILDSEDDKPQVQRIQDWIESHHTQTHLSGMLPDAGISPNPTPKVRL